MTQEPKQRVSFFSTSIGPYENRPMTTLHILHIYMSLVTQNNTYMTQNDAVLICGTNVTMNVSFLILSELTILKTLQTYHFIILFVLSVFSVCLTAQMVL